MTSYNKVKLSLGGLTIHTGPKDDGPRFYFRILTLDNLNAFIDQRFNINFAIKGDHVGTVEHIYGYSAADNGGTNTQPILSVEGLGQFNDFGLQLQLKGDLGAYNPDDLGAYGKKHEPSQYEFNIDLSWDQIDNDLFPHMLYQFASRQTVILGLSSKESESNDFSPTSQASKTSHHFWISPSVNCLNISTKESPSEFYRFYFIQREFLQRTFRYPDFKTSILVVADDLSFMESELSVNGKPIRFSQKIVSCRLNGSIDAAGMRLDLWGRLRAPEKVGVPSDSIKDRYHIQFFCSWEDIPKFLGYRFLIRDEVVRVRSKALEAG